MVSRSEDWLRAYELKGYHPKAIQQIVVAEEAKLEENLHNQIIEECKSRGWIYFHGSMAHRTYRTKGEPDFTIIADRGRVFLIECKSKSGKRSTDQLGLAMWAEKLGHTIHRVASFTAFLELVSNPVPA